MATINDLASGKGIFVIALADPDHPKVIQRIDGFEHPLSVTINSKGTMVAIAYGPPSKIKQPPIAIYQFKDGKLSELTTPSIPGWKEGDALMSAAFYPNEDILGLIYSEHPQLQLLKLSISDNKTSFSQWGNTIGLDKSPYMVRFTADGKYAICNSLYVGNDVLKKGFASPRGSVASKRSTKCRRSLILSYLSFYAVLNASGQSYYTDLHPINFVRMKP